MRPSHIIQVLEQEFSSTESGFHTPVMLWGPPGVGKSQLVAQVAERHKVTVIDIRLSQMEPSDLRGIPFREGNLVEWATPTMLPNEDRHGPKGLLFIDEITSAPPSVSAAAYQLILDRKLGDYQVPEGWAIVAAGNRQGDRGVTYNMPAPLANRFSHYEVETHLDDWVAWAYRHDIDERLIGFLRFRSDLLFEFDAARNPVAFPSPRSWEFTHRALQKFAESPVLLPGAIQACVGQAAGIELKAFIDSLDRMPDLDAIIQGEWVKVPEDIDLQYAIASALVGRAIKLNQNLDTKHLIGNVLSFAGQFKHREMGVMLISDLHRVIGAELFSFPEFANWADSIADIMLA
ncbi:MAG: hypothetical protein ACI845_003120 [Gammaproteobacteria bacterium]|jgi:hypothetical protein